MTDWLDTFYRIMMQVTFHAAFLDELHLNVHKHRLVHVRCRTPQYTYRLCAFCFLFLFLTSISKSRNHSHYL